MPAGFLVVFSEADRIPTKNIRMPVKVGKWTSVLINKASRHGAVTSRLCHSNRKSPAIFARNSRSDCCLVIDDLPKRLSKVCRPFENVPSTRISDGHLSVILKF